MPVPDTPAFEAVAPEALVEQARLAIEADRAKKPAQVWCAEGIALPIHRGMCWVCRRLKLSAWRDSDSQLSVQE